MVILLCRWLFAILALIYNKPSISQSGGGLHPFYTSVSEINYNQSSKILEISCRVFSNDMEACLEKLNHSKADLGNAAQKQAIDQMLMVYLNNHLQIQVNKKPAALQWVGREPESDASWIYLQAPCPERPGSIVITNTLLYDMFNSEINIIHVTVNGDRKSIRLNYPDKLAEFSF
jgi:hypothetical protein